MKAVNKITTEMIIEKRASDSLRKQYEDKIFKDYENCQLVTTEELQEWGKLYPHENIDEYDIGAGQLISNILVEDKLYQLHAESGLHTLYVGATGSGKTTQGIIPDMESHIKSAKKPSMIVLDLRKELLGATFNCAKANGYECKIINFKNPDHSVQFNILDMVVKYLEDMENIESEIVAVETSDGLAYSFFGKIYKSREELESDVLKRRNKLEEKAYDECYKTVLKIVPDTVEDKVFWLDMSRNGVQAILCAMIEDYLGVNGDEFPRITKEMFNMKTLCKIFQYMSLEKANDAWKFFSKRHGASKAKNFASGVYNVNDSTRSSAIAIISASLSKYQNATVRQLLEGTTLDLDEIVKGDKPYIIYLVFNDYESSSYSIIQQIVVSIYERLMKYADLLPNNRLTREFIFQLDEFASMPAWQDFATVISNCRSRGVSMRIVLQSLAQLDSIYGASDARVILDNMKIKIFFGSPNYDTRLNFCKSYGEKRIESPSGIYKCNGEKVASHIIINVPTVSASDLRVREGRAFISFSDDSFVLDAKMERCYKCKEYDYPHFNAEEYIVCQSEVEEYDLQIEGDWKIIENSERFDF